MNARLLVEPPSPFPVDAARDAAPSVVATLNHLRPTADKPVSYAFPPPGSYREPAQAPWGAPTDTAGRRTGRGRRGLGIASAVINIPIVERPVVRPEPAPAPA